MANRDDALARGDRPCGRADHPHARVILDASALLDLLVEKGVLSPGEFTEHRERYRQAHEREVRGEVLRRFRERQTPTDDAP